MVGIREQSRAENTTRILASARHQLAVHGATGLSMRAVARDVGMVSSAVFRYFPTREALLTRMIIESYHHLADALEAAASDAAGAAAWRAVANRARDWSRESPHEFQLIYGTPIPDYQAPSETVPAAARVAAPFLRIVAAGRPGTVDETAVGFMESVPGVSAGVLAVAVADLAQLIGFISLELAGHFKGVTVDGDRFYASVIERQIRTLGLP
ncbi:TetR/AcrR family transcriptional regulator [Tessaracoccus sp. SD287]|nr:TetR/AcrR family transcriptional regulator [Tessaracoccus sp. SD287]